MDLVVSVYNEDVSFIESIPITFSRVTLVCKNRAFWDARCVYADNFDGENYSYLKYIVDNYDSLAPISMFVMGSILKAEWKMLLCRKLHYLINHLDTPRKQRAFYDRIHFATMAHGTPLSRIPFDPSFSIQRYRQKTGGQAVQLCPASPNRLGKWIQSHAGLHVFNRAFATGVSFNGIFAATNVSIRAHPRHLYAHLMDELRKCPKARTDVTSHFMERLWKPLLDRGAGNLSGKNSCPDYLLRRIPQNGMPNAKSKPDARRSKPTEQRRRSPIARRSETVPTPAGREE